MIPETNRNTLISEAASAPMVMGDSMGPIIVKPAICIDPASVTTMTSSYLHRIPSGSRQWETYLQDLVNSTSKRSRRIKSERESINDFLQRFPILDVGGKKAI